MTEIMKRSVAKSLGLVRYRNGKPCPKGHAAERFVSTGQCTECLLDNARKWRGENPDKVKKYSKEYHNEHAEIRNQRGKAWREQNPELMKAFAKDWKKRNPESGRVHQSRRRAKEAASIGQHTIQDVRQLMEAQNGLCVYCRANIRELYQIDHMVPLSQGGSNAADNIQLLCPDCNQSKHTKTHEQFLNQLKKEKLL